MRTHVPALALIAIATLFGGSATAAECPEGIPPWFEWEDCGVCEMPKLPGIDCAVDATCCTTGALDLDINTDDTLVCDEAIAFAAVQNSCPADFEGHIQLFEMNEWSWEDNGLRSCDGESPFGRHWVAGTYLAAAMDNAPGVVRHRPTEYLMTGQANATDYHPQLEHRLSPGLKAYGALWTWDGAVADTIRFACRAFARSGSAETVGGTFLHEAWHSVYHGHDVDAIVEDDTIVTPSMDNYYAHSTVAQPIADGFNPNAWTTDDNPGFVIHTVYQIEHEYLCDLVSAPRNWVPRAGLFEAIGQANSIIANNIINQSQVPGWALCGSLSIPARTTRDPDLPDGARMLDIEFTGLVVETSQGGSDDDTEPVNAARSVVVLPGGVVADVGNPLLGTYADGEVWLEIQLQAALASDNDTVDFSYNVLFYEDDADDTDCDQDLAGDNCPGMSDSSVWVDAQVDSLSSLYTHSFVLTNATADPGEDLVELTMHVEELW